MKDMKDKPVAKLRGRSPVSRTLRLMSKEMRETLRDRRTVITLVLMPLLVYPLLSITFNTSLLLVSEKVTDSTLFVGVATDQDAAILRTLLFRGEQALDTFQERAEEGQGEEEQGEEQQNDAVGRESSRVEVRGASVKLTSVGSGRLEQYVANTDLDAGVRIHRARSASGPESGPGPGGPLVECELIYRENSPTSQRAVRFVQERLRALNEAALRGLLAKLQMPSDIPAEMRFKKVSPSREAPFSLATFVPLVLILMTITGSVYPAIDLTAGERERGTLETLIAAPVSRLMLLVAKYAAVLTVAVLTAIVNLVAMTVTLLTSSLGRRVFPDGLSFTLMIEILGLMILFAAFFSAIVLALTSFARSFKEAQAYLIPVMLLAISPGLLSLMPGVELSGLLAVAPLVNIVLLSRDILEGTAEPGTAFLAILSTAAYAVAAIALAARIFGNDALLYASQGSWTELFQRPSTRRVAATPAAALACLALLFPCFFVLANLAQVAAVSMQVQLLINSLVTIVVFGALPLLFGFSQRVTLRAGFQIQPASRLAFLATFALGVTLWPVAYELYMFGEWAGLASRDQGQFVLAERVLDAVEAVPPLVLILLLAVIPAVMEEFFFRGYLFQGLRGACGERATILVSALLFGLFHVLSPSALTPVRFLPSTLLGLVLGWVCYRTRSVLPCMLLHACHNGLLVLMVLQRHAMTPLGWNLRQSQHIPLSWLASLTAIGVIAAAGLYVVTRRSAADGGP
ncbi:MAG: ABC transporter permease subunit/CPBP intramembrane protease [Planctomycetota bacterium]